MRCTQTNARSETKDGREEFWRKHNRRVEEYVEADMSDHSSPSSPSSSRAFDGFTHIYIYTLSTSCAFPSLPPFSILCHSHNMPLNYSKWDMLEVGRRSVSPITR